MSFETMSWEERWRECDELRRHNLEQIAQLEAEVIELRRALRDARAVIKEAVDRARPLLPFVLAQVPLEGEE